MPGQVNAHLAAAESMDAAQLTILQRLDRSVTVVDKRRPQLPSRTVEIVPVHQEGKVGVRLSAFGLGVKFEVMQAGLIAGPHVQREIGQ